MTNAVRKKHASAVKSHAVAHRRMNYHAKG